MDLKQTAAELSEIERKTVSALADAKQKSVEETAKQSGLPEDSVRRAFAWLKEKGFAELSEETKSALKLMPAGKSSLSKGLPEKLFVEAIHSIGGKAGLEEARKKSLLNPPEFNAAMGLAKKNAWVSIAPSEKGPELSLTGLEKDLLEGKYSLEIALKKINSHEALSKADEDTLVELKKRELAKEEILTEWKAKLTPDGNKALGLLKEIKQRAFNVAGEVPQIVAGKRQPYIQFVNQIRQRLVALGFEEMNAPLITQEFYNFDVLFQPQNHPARDWSDTYQLKNPKFGELPSKGIVAAIKAMHENGGKSKSKGWQYKWSEEKAKRLMPASHTTAHSARQLVNGIRVPGKYFAIARCYRPDVLDATHLIEFNQMEGFIAGEELSFRHLLGMLKQFAEEITHAKEVKFVPSYFPFTEPSVELIIKHPQMGWIEIGGAGMFRPEMLENLGIKGQALAWGLGLDRLAMFKLGLKDIRYLFSDDLKWLRESKLVVVD